jgi:hypothetical protein
MRGIDLYHRAVEEVDAVEGAQQSAITHSDTVRPWKQQKFKTGSFTTKMPATLVWKRIRDIWTMWRAESES